MNGIKMEEKEIRDEYKCRECGEIIEEGEEAIICFDWVAKYESGMIPDIADTVLYTTPYYYHEKCFYMRGE